MACYSSCAGLVCVSSTARRRRCDPTRFAPLVRPCQRSGRRRCASIGTPVVAGAGRLRPGRWRAARRLWRPRHPPCAAGEPRFQHRQGAVSQRPRNGTPASRAAAPSRARCAGSRNMASAMHGMSAGGVDRARRRQRGEHRVAGGFAVGGCAADAAPAADAVLALADLVAAQHQRARRGAEFGRQRAGQGGFAGARQSTDRDHHRLAAGARYAAAAVQIAARDVRRCRGLPRHARGSLRAATEKTGRPASARHRRCARRSDSAHGWPPPGVTR